MARLFVLCLLALTVSQVFACDSTWHQYNGKCYRVIESSIGTMSDADRHCGQHRSRVLTIQSADEQKHLEQFLFKEQQLDQNVWLGGNRQNLKFAWRNDGVLIAGNVFQNWANGKPTHNFPRACLQLNSVQSSEPGKWSDNYCFAMNAIVCEKIHVPGGDLVIPDVDTDGSCCKNLENRLKKLEQKLGERVEHFEKQLEKRDQVIDKLRDQVNDAKSLASGFRHRLDEVFDRLDQYEQYRREVLQEISSNFTSVASVFGHFNQQFYELNQALESGLASGNSRPQIDLSKLKSELNDYINDRIDRYRGDGDALTDAKLDYVHYRRALMVKKNGKWIQLGYV